MTTVVRTRNPLETLSMSQQPTGRRRSQRLRAAYDEEDDGFLFTRGAAKRAKTAPAPADPESGRETVPKSTRKRKERDVVPVPESAPAPAEKKSRARKMSFSTPKGENELVVQKKRKTTRSSVGKEDGESGSHHAHAGEIADLDSIDMVGMTPDVDGSMADGKTVDSSKATVIALPFSDTPIINRNKELRKKGTGGARRSSLGLRGRRASSLIDGGHNAIPHREVDTSEFYKHIEAEGLSEPRRMKQLLTWTGERALGEKPSHGDPDSAAALAARVIKESLLKDFGNKSEFSDWFNREETAPTKIVKKPNPRNIEIQENLTGLEERIKSLREERDQWKALAKPPPSLPPLFLNEKAELDASQINTSLLDPEQAAILETITSAPALTLRNEVSQRLRKVQSTLEFKVDHLSDGVHKLEQYQDTASRVADKILALSAMRLEEREKREKEQIGTRDLPMQEVLRSLSRILPENSSGT